MLISDWLRKREPPPPGIEPRASHFTSEYANHYTIDARPEAQYISCFTADTADGVLIPNLLAGTAFLTAFIILCFSRNDSRREEEETV